MIDFPCAFGARNAQVGHGEARQTCLGFRPAAGGALVADLAARPGGRTGKRRDGGRVVVRLHLHQDVHLFLAVPVHARGGVSKQARAERALDDRRVVAIGGQHAARIVCVGVADHREQRLRLARAVDRPLGVEDLVAAVLGVRLREHHQLHVGGIALERAVGGEKVVDLVGSERETEALVGLDERLTAALRQRDGAQRTRRVMIEEPLRVLDARHPRFDHTVVEHGRQRGELRRLERLCGSYSIGDAALDAANRSEAAHVRDIGGLARPRRNRARARHDQDQLAGFIARFEVRAVGEQARESRMLRGLEPALGVDDVHPARGDAADTCVTLAQGAQELVESER